MTLSLSRELPPKAIWRGEGSAVTLRVLAEELERRGIDPRWTLRRVGCSMADAENPFGRVSRHAVLTFSELAAAETRDPTFHLVATQNARVGAFGAADFIATMAPTVGLGLSRASAVYGVINDGLRPVPVVGTTAAMLRLEPVYEDHLHACDIETLAVAIACRIRGVTRGVHGPAWARFRAADPGYRSAFEAILQCPIDYGADADAIGFSRVTWDARPASAHPSIVDLVSLVTEPVLSAIMPTPGLVASVERLIAERLPDGGLSAAQVASILGMSERTLHRKLTKDGTRFGDIVDAVRQRVAEEHLARGEKSIAEIADELGFSEPAAFTRAYRRWTGRAPSSQRASALRSVS